MIQYFLSAIQALFCGAQGIKQARLGAEAVYTRPGGCLCFTLNTDA